MPDPAPNPDAYPALRRAVDGWRAAHPALSRAPGWPVWLGALTLLALFAVIALPFLIPLGGPEVLSPEALADPDGFFVALDGETLYAVHTPGEGPAVLLLHGFGGSTVTWRETMPALAAAGYDVYALDLRGFGLSDKGYAADYSHPAQARRVVAWMDAVGLGRVALVGHSMGGSVAAHVALSAPDRVSRLVLVDAALLEQDAGGTVPRGLLDVPFLRRWAQLGLRRAAPDYVDDLLRDAASNDGALSPELMAGYQRALRTPEWELGLLGILRDGNRNTPPVRQLQMPTLIIWGARDTWVPPENGAQLEAVIPEAERVELDGVGHLPMHEAPAAFHAALIDFLGRSAS